MYKKSIENKIRFKALLLYAILAVACMVTAISVWELQQDMQAQKEYVADHYQTLSLTNRILTTVKEVQVTANRRPVGRKRKIFQMKLEEISLMIDSLNTQGNHSFKKEMGEEMISLLNEKAVIVNRLHNLFKRTNPVDPIREKLLEVHPVLEKDSIQVTTVIQDTTIRQAPKRKFWRRFADVFSPPASNDTIIQTITFQADTVVAAQEETKAILTDVRYFAEDASLNYERRMQDIASQIGSLLEADQAISARLSELLIRLYQSSIGSTMLEIEKAEVRIGEYYRYLTIGAICFLALILVFIVLILQDVNRAREARSELQKSNDRIRQLMESRHQMLLSVSHDIKSPLNSILGYLELWKDEADKPQHDICSM
ncbi:MAG: histidine kinase dimerization/phospho-acceptor domain-containing protein, partial [Bacteroidales bacterium]